MTTENLQLRRKVAGAKSYLSRLQNERERAIKSRSGNIQQINEATDKVEAQYKKFRALVQELRQVEGR